MTTSELIEELITLMIRGEPEHSKWASYETNYENCQKYLERIAELKYEIDQRVPS